MAMKNYRMHSVVSAAKIAFCTSDQIHVQDGQSVVGVNVSRETIAETAPQPGEYLVKHGDGSYEIMSAQDFEAYFVLA